VDHLSKLSSVLPRAIAANNSQMQMEVL